MSPCLECLTCISFLFHFIYNKCQIGKCAYLTLICIFLYLQRRHDGQPRRIGSTGMRKDHESVDHANTSKNIFF